MLLPPVVVAMVSSSSRATETELGCFFEEPPDEPLGVDPKRMTVVAEACDGAVEGGGVDAVLAVGREGDEALVWRWLWLLAGGRGDDEGPGGFSICDRFIVRRGAAATARTRRRRRRDGVMGQWGQGSGMAGGANDDERRRRREASEGTRAPGEGLESAQNT